MFVDRSVRAPAPVMPVTSHDFHECHQKYLLRKPNNLLRNRIMGLSGRVTVHFGTSFTSKRTGTPKPLKIKLNKSRRQLAQEQEQQKRRIASE
jgi:hypothetical protein